MIYIVLMYVNPASKRIVDVFSTKEEAEKYCKYWSSQLPKAYKHKIVEWAINDKFVE